MRIIHGTPTLEAAEVAALKSQGLKLRYAVETLAFSATPTPNSDYPIINFGTVTAAAEFQTPSGSPADGDFMLIRGVQDGTGYAITFNSSYAFTDDVTNTVTSTASKYWEVLFRYHSGRSKWVAQAVNNG